jgi:transposase InsO family protein
VLADPEEAAVVLVELNVVEQRYQAVLEVLNEGAAVTDVARRFGVARQTVQVWLRRYAVVGLGGLADHSSKPLSCPHQMAPEVEARIVEMRWAHPGWGPRTILFWLERSGVSPLPGRTSVERCLIRHGLVTPEARKRKRSDYKRWERSRAMELWQMDIVGGVRLVDGCEAKIVSGIDDHSRFVVCARVVARATARPVCDALAHAMRAHGVPGQILTDNGKVFTARFGPGPGPVLFVDRICVDNGIGHILTAPRSPTTTGKVERWHKTLRGEFLDTKVFASIADAQAQLDGWVHHYNHERPHQAIGRVPPIERFQLAEPRQQPATPLPPAVVATGPVTTRRVSAKGTIGFATVLHKVGVWLAGQTVEVTCEGGLVQIHHRGGARRHPRPPASARQADRRCRARTPAEAVATVGGVAVGDPQGRLVGQRVLRRSELSGRYVVSASPSASCRRR